MPASAEGSDTAATLFPKSPIEIAPSHGTSGGLWK